MLTGLKIFGTQAENQLKFVKLICNSLIISELQKNTSQRPSSIKTRIKTIPVLHNVLPHGLRDHLPLKQGLRLLSQVSHTP